MRCWPESQLISVSSRDDSTTSALTFIGAASDHSTVGSCAEVTPFTGTNLLLRAHTVLNDQDSVSQYALKRRCPLLKAKQICSSKL